MSLIKVWTKQHESMLQQLRKQGRYTAQKDYVSLDLQEHAGLVLTAYEWLVQNSPDAARKPPDVQLPVWVSFESETAMLPSPGTVILELQVEEDSVTRVNIAKWGAILNYAYIPADGADARRHGQLLQDYGVSDAKACMTQFYPQIKREIMDSWRRLFDESVSLGSDACYGLLWEIREEWITNVTR